jgi:hypothetical protein
MLGDDAGYLGGTSVFDADIFVTLQRVDQSSCAVYEFENFNEQDYSMNVENELAAALQTLLWQTNQMRGMFQDDDGAIDAAVNAAEAALESYRKAEAAKGS